MPAARESVHTTNDIIEFCKDIKVLNRKDLRILINWRKAVKASNKIDYYFEIFSHFFILLN